MEKGNKKKREIQNALKTLAIKKGYANVTMKDIGEYVGLSVGGLYHHYHSVDEVFSDLIASETGDVWAVFEDIHSYNDLMNAMDIYFAAEKKELLGEGESVNTLMYQYYFSHPEDERIMIMKEAHDTVVSCMTDILGKVFKNKKQCHVIAEHMCIVLHGLVDLSFSGSITGSIIDNEFAMLKRYFKDIYDKTEE